jgi:hypothetical protein
VVHSRRECTIDILETCVSLVTRIHPDEYGQEMVMTANTHFSTTGKAPPNGSKHIPFSERPTCSVDEATKASGLSRSMIYEKMKSGELEWTKVNARRLINVRSLFRLLGVA